MNSLTIIFILGYWLALWALITYILHWAVNQHGGCRGLTIPVWFDRQVEIWWCPRNEVIEPHVHPDIDSVILNLGGQMEWTIGDKTRVIRGLFRRKSTGKWGLSLCPVNRECEHGAKVLGSFGLFLNFQKWYVTPTSASANIRYTNNTHENSKGTHPSHLSEP